MSSPYASQDSFAFGLYEQPDQFRWTQTDEIEAVEGGMTPDSTRETTVETDPLSQQETQLQPEKLGFCQLTDWDKDKIYDEDPPRFIHYSIEWKVKVKKREVSKDTEQDVVLAPASYWRLLLQPKLEKLLCRKLAKNRPVMSEETNVVISITDRSQRDLIKRFDETNVEWSVIERQLVLWSDLFRAGKKLRVNISFIYIETSLPAATSRKADKRGTFSTTNMMLDKRATQLDAEEASTGQPSIWKDVYNVMRCRSGSCNSKPHCWVDPVGKKHYKLKSPHLRSLIEYVEQGHVLQGHDDVPEYVRQQLYIEEQQKRQKPASTSAANNAPIHITNVLPAPPYSTPPLVSSLTGTPAPDSISTPFNRLDIPRPRARAVEDYCAWQQSQDPEEKEAYQKACKVMKHDSMDLELIHQDPDPEFLIK